MKKLLLLPAILVPLFILGILIYKNQSTNPQNSSAQEATPIPTAQNNTITVDSFNVSWFEINDIENLKLIPNFTEKLSTKEVLNTYNCKLLINAGFYTKENTPLGLFIYGGNTVSNFQNNSLVDGILSINQMTTPRITRNLPEDYLINAVQTGPIIKENGSFITLKIVNDGQSRRSIAGITGDNNLYFLSFYDHNSQYSGPLLADLPKVLKDFEEKSGIVFADAINLDGGSASAFYSEGGNSLSEISPVGAFFCQP